MKTSTIVVFALLVLSVTANPFSNIFSRINPVKGDAVFVPAKLPCSHSLKGILYGNVQGQFTNAYNITVFRDSSLFAMKTESSVDTYYAKIDRFDLCYEESGKSYCPEYYTDGGKCESFMFEKETEEQEIARSFSFFLEPQTFESVSKSTYRGVTCNMYVKTFEKNEKLIAYTTDNGYYIAIKTYIEKEPITIELKYNLDPISLSTFAMDTKYAGCEEKAYTIPPEQC